MLYNVILVGGLEHGLYDFPYIENVIIPTDNIVQRGRKTTNQYIYILFCKKNATDMDFLWTEIDEIEHEPPRKSHA